jgi:hypothetical protein
MKPYFSIEETARLAEKKVRRSRAENCTSMKRSGKAKRE